MAARDFRVVCVSVARSPITHMARVEGNEAVVMREPAGTNRGIAWVPCLTGNALRHRCVRSTGARWLVDAYGLAGQLSLPQLNFLFHGGNLTEGGGKEDTRRIADMQRLWPFLRLLGGCVPDQVLHGSLSVGIGTLVCEENRPTLKYLLGGDRADAIPARLRPAEAFIAAYQYTRGDARKTASDLVPVTDGTENVDSNLMIFAGQQVVRGAAFVHDFTFLHASELELGALVWSLRLWQQAGGTIGGQSARGHGRLDTTIVGTGDDDLDAAVEAYIDYARSVRDEAVAWLDAAFAKKSERTAKGKSKAPAEGEHASAGAR